MGQCASVWTANQLVSFLLALFVGLAVILAGFIVIPAANLENTSVAGENGSVRRSSAEPDRYSSVQVPIVNAAQRKRKSHGCHTKNPSRLAEFPSMNPPIVRVRTPPTRR